MILFFAIIINAIVIATTILVHYEVLTRMSILLSRLKLKKRRQLLISVFGSLLAHAISIWIFAIVYFLLIDSGKFGYIEVTGIDAAPFVNNIYNCVYFSIVSYTSLGYGDLIPHGHLRALAGLEALTGLVLIAWTASFIFVQMERKWHIDENDEDE